MPLVCATCLEDVVDAPHHLEFLASTLTEGGIVLRLDRPNATFDEEGQAVEQEGQAQAKSYSSQGALGPPGHGAQRRAPP